MKIEDHVDAHTPGVTLINESTYTRPGRRWFIAKELAAAARFFVSIDDDLFLRPQQYATLFERFSRDCDVPHGCSGQSFDLRARKMVDCLQYRDGEVDILNRLYVFTREHVDECLRLSDLVGLGDVRTIANGEDLLMSFAGPRAPHIHDLGLFMECPTGNAPGIATWSMENFFEERIALYQQLLRLKPRDGQRELHRGERGTWGRSSTESADRR